MQSIPGVFATRRLLVVGVVVVTVLVSVFGHACVAETPSQTTSDCQLGFYAKESACSAAASDVGCRSHSYVSSSGACNGSRCNVSCKPY